MGIFSDILLTVDFDRTLTGPDGKIPPRNLEAIRYFMDNGGSFTVNTGRSIPSFKQYMDVIPANAPFLLYNGSAAYGNGKLLNAVTMDMDAWQVIRTLEREFPDLSVEVQGVEHHYLPHMRPEVDALYTQMGWPHCDVKEGRDMGPFLKFTVLGVPDRMEIATWFEASAEQKAYFDRVDARIRELYGDQAVTFRAAARIIDVHAKGVSKICAARNLQKQLHKRILICVGDAENDLTMLEGADYGFCPADGVVADRFPNVCPCGQGAVADVIYKKIPELLGISLT